MKISTLSLKALTFGSFSWMTACRTKVIFLLTVSIKLKSKSFKKIDKGIAGNPPPHPNVQSSATYFWYRTTWNKEVASKESNRCFLINVPFVSNRCKVINFIPFQQQLGERNQLWNLFFTGCYPEPFQSLDEFFSILFHITPSFLGIVSDKREG